MGGRCAKPESDCRIGEKSKKGRKGGGIAVGGGGWSGRGFVYGLRVEGVLRSGCGGLMVGG